MNAPLIPQIRTTEPQPDGGTGASMSPEMLDVLCPMHLIFNRAGEILHRGPTLKKMMRLVGTPDGMLLDSFEVLRPRGIKNMADLKIEGGTKLHLKLRGDPETSLKGVAVALDRSGETYVLNLSFGISIIEGVRDFALSNADFAATDLAIEMLYLIEAKNAVMDASRTLNLRLHSAKMMAERAAQTDPLTGLKNRRALDLVLMELLQRGAPFAMMHIDLDFFKSVNDTLGHAAGDHVLSVVASLMLEETRSGDIVARVGGDEFTILLPEVSGEDVLRKVGRRIIKRIEEPITFEEEICNVSASIGTVWSKGGEETSAADVMANADFALYMSKNAGRSRQTIYHPHMRKDDPPAGMPKSGNRRRED